MAEIAIFIKSMFRDRVLLNCVRSLQKYCDDSKVRFYIANEGKVSNTKQNLFDKLESKGHKVLKLPMGTGASKARNIMLNRLNEEQYVLRMDDDFEFSEETSLEKMKEVLDNNKEIGAIADLERQMGIGKGAFSGEISEWQGDLKLRGSTLIKELKLVDDFDFEKTDDIKYALCDYSRNMLLIKRELFNDIKWDDSLKFGGEHEDFLLQIKQSRWRLAFTPDSVHLHRDDLNREESTSDYKEKKFENKDTTNLMKDKWDIKTIVIRRPLKSKLKAGLVKVIRIFQNQLS